MPLKALIAGGGSGDATLMLAQQMATAGRAGSVTWLDRSAAARKVAGARVAARSLDNVIFEEGSLLDLPTSGLGPFDYIDCCGVLHHLPDPAAGLRALVSVLAPGGGLAWHHRIARQTLPDRAGHQKILGLITAVSQAEARGHGWDATAVAPDPHQMGARQNR